MVQVIAAHVAISISILVVQNVYLIASIQAYSAP